MSGKIVKGPEFKPTLDKITLGEFFFKSAEKYAEEVCQLNADSGESETYSSVKKRATRLAIQLRNKGITSKDVIAVCSYNSLDNTIPIIATVCLGAKIVNLDPTLSVRNTKHLLSLVKPSIVFVDHESLDLIESCEHSTEIIAFGNFSKYVNFFDLVLPCPNEDSFQPVKIDVDETACMFFSSGTTGLPKAICHTHRSMLTMVEILKEGGCDLECILHVTSFFWLSGIYFMLRTSIQGGTRAFARSFNGEKIFEMIEKYKLSALFAAPILTYQLTSVENPERFDVSSFRYLITAGTPLTTHQYEKLTKLFPKAYVLFSYGMSEVGTICTFNPNKHEHLIRTKIGSCGTVPPGSSLKVVNPDSDEILGPNQRGEIRVKSPCLMKGYYQMDSFSCLDGQGFIKTGDVGYFDEDDCLYVVGRIKEMFKYQSWHIVPSSIEAVLLEYPAVEDAAVFGLPAGEDGEIPAACVVLKAGFDAGKEDIEKFVEERVSDREKLRGGVTFVTSLPKTPTGKLIRSEVRNIVMQST